MNGRAYDGQEGARFYWRLLRRRWGLIAVACLIAAASGALYSHERTPRYRATSEVLVTPLPADEGALQGLDVVQQSSDPTRSVHTAAGLLQTAPAARATAERLGPPWTQQRVADRVDIQPIGGTNILAITGEATSPEAARWLANAYAVTAIQQRDERLSAVARERMSNLRRRLTDEIPEVRVEMRERIAELSVVAAEGDPSLELVQRALVPSSPVGPSLALIVSLSALLGLAIGVGAAMLIQFADVRISDEEQLTSAYPVPILARVPKTRNSRAGALMEEFRTLVSGLPRRSDQARVILVTSGGTGDGKTSVVLNLVKAELEAGRSVILFDCDLRKQLLVGRRKRRRPATATSTVAYDPAHIRTMFVGRFEMSLIESRLDPRNLQVLLVPPLTTTSSIIQFAAVLPGFLREARQMADTVVVDTAPLGEVGDALPLLEECDHIFVVARLGKSTRDNLSRVMELLGSSPHRAAVGLIVIADKATTRDYARQGYYATSSLPDDVTDGATS